MRQLGAVASLSLSLSLVLAHRGLGLHSSGPNGPPVVPRVGRAQAVLGGVVGMSAAVDRGVRGGGVARASRRPGRGGRAGVARVSGSAVVGVSESALARARVSDVMLPRTRVGEIQRSRLLTGAVAVIDELGYPRATVGRITARARLSRRTFYQMFANRDECFAAVLGGPGRGNRRGARGGGPRGFAVARASSYGRVDGPLCSSISQSRRWRRCMWCRRCAPAPLVLERREAVLSATRGGGR